MPFDGQRMIYAGFSPIEATCRALNLAYPQARNHLRDRHDFDGFEQLGFGQRVLDVDLERRDLVLQPYAELDALARGALPAIVREQFDRAGGHADLRKAEGLRGAARLVRDARQVR